MLPASVPRGLTEAGMERLYQRQSDLGAMPRDISRLIWRHVEEPHILVKVSGNATHLACKLYDTEGGTVRMPAQLNHSSIVHTCDGGIYEYATEYHILNVREMKIPGTETQKEIPQKCWYISTDCCVLTSDKWCHLTSFGICQLSDSGSNIITMFPVYGYYRPMSLVSYGYGKGMAAWDRTGRKIDIWDAYSTQWSVWDKGTAETNVLYQVSYQATYLGYDSIQTEFIASNPNRVGLRLLDHRTGKIEYDVYGNGLTCRRISSFDEQTLVMITSRENSPTWRSVIYRLDERMLQFVRIRAVEMTANEHFTAGCLHDQCAIVKYIA